MAGQSSRHQKIPDLLKRVRMCIESGNYKFTNHALERKLERSLNFPDILYVLKNGCHESAKDSWDELFNTWNYSIRGHSIGGQSIRVIVSFEPSTMLVITVIRLKN